MVSVEGIDSADWLLHQASALGDILHA